MKGETPYQPHKNSAFLELAHRLKLTQKDDPTTETQTRKKIQNRIHTRANAFVYDDLKKRTKEKEREMEKLGKAGEKRGQNRQRAPLPIHS